MISEQKQTSKFDHGQIVSTPAALEVIKAAGHRPSEFLARHLSGDWGTICNEDRQINDLALTDGSRLLSSYTTSTGEKVWIITEAADQDGRRMATTILLPSEY